jgi:hypothetical protein
MEHSTWLRTLVGWWGLKDTLSNASPFRKHMVLSLSLSLILYDRERERENFKVFSWTNTRPFLWQQFLNGLRRPYKALKHRILNVRNTVILKKLRLCS